MLTLDSRNDLIVLLGEQDPSATFYRLTALADAILDKFAVKGTDAFLSGITAYDPRDNKITAIRDLRAARRDGTVDGSDNLRECKDAVEAWIAKNPASTDPWANVSRASQYGHGDSWHDDEPPF